MSRLRTVRLLARLVLVWFALAVGVSIASPLIQPQVSVLACSIGGVMKLLPVGEDADGALAGAGLPDCPLCLQMAAPPAQALAPAARQPENPGPAPRSGPVHAIRCAGPSPGRGPPAHS